MAKRSLREYGVGGDKHTLDEYVDSVLLISRITRSASRRYGAAIEVSADVVGEGGEALAAGVRIVTFAGPVVRDLGAVLGDADSMTFPAGDYLAVRVAKVGDAFVIEDDEQPEADAPEA